MRFNVCPHLTIGDKDHFHTTTIILQPSHSAEVSTPLQALEDSDSVIGDYSCVGPSLCKHVLLRPLDYISQSKDTRVRFELKGRFDIEASVLEDRCGNSGRGTSVEEICVNTTRTKGRNLQARSAEHS